MCVLCVCVCECECSSNHLDARQPDRELPPRQGPRVHDRRLHGGRRRYHPEPHRLLMRPLASSLELEALPCPPLAALPEGLPWVPPAELEVLLEVLPWVLPELEVLVGVLLEVPLEGLLLLHLLVWHLEVLLEPQALHQVEASQDGILRSENGILDKCLSNTLPAIR